jgi:uncharacterized protein (TIGR02001 family)
MKKFAIAAAASLAVMSFAAAANAQDEGPSVSFNVAVTSDYVFRGVSQTEEDPAIQGGVDLTSGMFYAGAWASTISFPGDDESDVEIDIYGGIKPEAAGWTFDIGGIYYAYPGEPSGVDYDFFEAKLAASRAVGPASIGAAVFYSPEFFGETGTAVYYEVNGSVSPADGWTIGGALGRQDVDYDGDYTTWNLGVSYAFTDNIALDLRYHDTGEHDFGDIYESRVVATLKGVF